MKKPIKRLIIIAVTAFWLDYLLAFFITCLIHQGFKTEYLLHAHTALFFVMNFLISILIFLWYYTKNYWLFNSKNIMKGNKRDKQIDVNLEQSRFQTEDEIKKNFRVLNWESLKETEIVGSPIEAMIKDDKLEIAFAKPSHAMVIGTTGSGKTTTYVSPMIQILSELKNKPSLLISDPKGELYQLHSKALKERGYEVKILDLRNPYNSVRWNPLERAYEMYQEAIQIDEKYDGVKTDDESYIRLDKRDYQDEESLKSAIQVKKQTLLDEVYEDLNDVATVICPIHSKSEPMWESGAKNFILAIMLAMLEDSEDSRLGMTKDKFNFFSVMKVATNTENDCEELQKYFEGRKPLSKAVSLAKQVLSSSDKTRASYLTTVFDKLSMFSDQSLCSLTSSNEIEFASMGEKPTALFLQIPDEKETRHTLASMVILQAYKELVRKANQSEGLTLKKPVYFILDEFGNLPKIHKLEQMITVGRSRNIWMNLVVQSYSQLSKVYDDKSADIIKSNCNIQVFIGTTDLKTIEDFSKRCGNYSVIQRNVTYSTAKSDDISSNSSSKERPLIYPSELARLNSGKDIGNVIVTVFGYYPIKSKFTPSYLCPFYELKKAEEDLGTGRYFDEEKAFYDMRIRNKKIFEEEEKETSISSYQKDTSYIKDIIEAIKLGITSLNPSALKKANELFENKDYENLEKLVIELVDTSTPDKKEIPDELIQAYRRFKNIINIRKEN